MTFEIAKGFQQVFFGSVSLFCLLVGVPLNVMALISFNETRKSIVTRIIYRLILLTDGIICMLMLPICVSNFAKMAPMIFSLPFVCELWSYLWGCVSRVSVFLIAVLSVMRTKSLILPLHKSRQHHVIIPVALYIAAILLQGTVPMWYKVEIHYYEPYQCCVWLLMDLFKHLSPTEEYIYYIVTYLVEFVFPMVPIVSSSLISIYKLKTSDVQGSSSETRASKRQATRMILALTGVYIVFNIPYCLILTLDSIELFTHEVYIWSENVSTPTKYFIYNFIYIHTIALNSAINTIIYTYKMKSMQRMWIGLRRSVYSSKKIKLTPSPSQPANTFELTSKSHT